MKSNELRIGNYIKIFTTITQVEYLESGEWGNMLGSSNFAERSIDQFEPIELNEEWLTIFIDEFNLLGWDGDYYTFLQNDTMCSVRIYKNGKVTINIESQEDSKIKFKHSSVHKDGIKLHRFQNLFFALTNQELEIEKKES